MGDHKISAIIITLNEERYVERLLRQLSGDGDLELIVSDGEALTGQAGLREGTRNT